MTILYVLLGILLLGILVAVHEWGHFISARILGIDVVEYAIGFGPKLIGWKSRKYDTRFSIRLIPLGGYCAFYGEDDAAGTTKDDPRAYAKQPVWKRMISVLMGPGMNFILAFVVAFFYFWILGVAVTQPMIVSVSEGGPAHVCGIQPGDVLLMVDDTPAGDTANTASAALGAWLPDEDGLALTVRRGEETLTISGVMPRFDEQDNRYLIGVNIASAAVTRTDETGRQAILTTPINAIQAVSVSWRSCVNAGSAILDALRALVTTGEGFEDTSGPVGVVSIVSEQVRDYGAEGWFNLLIVISINLGIMNLLPIPGLDGSRFLFMLLEAIRRKPIPQEKEAMVHLAGMVLLFGLMIFFTVRDILRLF